MEKNDKMKKQSRVRLWFQAAWFVLTNGYVRGYTKGMIFTGPSKVVCLPGLNCYSCPGALGACPMGALQAVLGNVSYRFSLYVFGSLAAMGVVFGRLICGWMCPFGLFQDLLYKIKVKAKRKNLPGHKYLKYLRYVILVVFPILLVTVMLDATGASMPWFCEWICPSGMLLGAIPLVAVNEGLRAAIGARFFWKLFVLIAVTVLAVFFYRPFCKYLCPLGAIYGLFNPIASYRIVVDTDKCVSCGTCQKACGMDIKTFETPNSPDCIRCGSCMAACPAGALESTWHKTGQKIKKRCFIDDGELIPAKLTAAKDALAEDTAAAAEGAETKTDFGRRAVFLGILMAAAGASSIYVAIRGAILSPLIGHFTIEAYQDMNTLTAVMGALWVAAAVVIFLTGIYTIVYRNERERLLSVDEKLKLAHRAALIGVLVGIIGVVLDLGMLMTFLTPMIMDTFIYLWISVLRLQVRRMYKDMAAGQKSGASWWILSVINILLVLTSPWLFFLLTKVIHV